VRHEQRPTQSAEASAVGVADRESTTVDVDRGTGQVKLRFRTREWTTIYF
jgi:hypothetical protein